VSNKINAATMLQGYCSTHLFYFVAHETISAIKIKQNIYFIAAFISLQMKSQLNLRSVVMILLKCYNGK